MIRTAGLRLRLVPATWQLAAVVLVALVGHLVLMAMPLHEQAPHQPWSQLGITFAPPSQRVDTHPPAPETPETAITSRVAHSDEAPQVDDCSLMFVVSPQKVVSAPLAAASVVQALVPRTFAGVECPAFPPIARSRAQTRALLQVFRN
ncbi:MAG: hypothetical protein HY332_17090 [Chloroflexi bacterium]|nr:hypothetical protein [Chloroflexota bacterium]